MMPARPLVSVILSVHDGERYLPAALASLQRQHLRDFELIAIDDGSTDGTSAILTAAALRDPRVVFVRNGRNLGLTRSLNIGLRRARGRYVARQDADDLSLPGRLAAQVAYLEERPALQLLGSAFVEIDERGAQRAVRRLPLRDTEIRWHLHFHNAFCHSSVLFRQELVAAGLVYDESLRYSQDYDLWRRIAAHGLVANLREPLVALRIHGASIGARHTEAQQRCADEVAHRALLDLDPALRLSLEEVYTLRCWLVDAPLWLGLAEWPLCRALLRALVRFRAAPSTDPAVAHRIRRGILFRLLPALSVGAVAAFAREGLLRGEDAIPLCAYVMAREMRHLRRLAARGAGSRRLPTCSNDAEAAGHVDP